VAKMINCKMSGNGGGRPAPVSFDDLTVTGGSYEKALGTGTFTFEFTDNAQSLSITGARIQGGVGSISRGGPPPIGSLFYDASNVTF